MYGQPDRLMGVMKTGSKLDMPRSGGSVGAGAEENLRQLALEFFLGPIRMLLSQRTQLDRPGHPQQSHRGGDSLRRCLLTQDVPLLGHG